MRPTDVGTVGSVVAAPGNVAVILLTETHRVPLRGCEVLRRRGDRGRPARRVGFDGQLVRCGARRERVALTSEANCRQNCRQRGVRGTKSHLKTHISPSQTSGAKGTRTPDPYTARTRQSVRTGRLVATEDCRGRSPARNCRRRCRQKCGQRLVQKSVHGSREAP